VRPAQLGTALRRPLDSRAWTCRYLSELSTVYMPFAGKKKRVVV
jgi:hypothetical protein